MKLDIWLLLPFLTFGYASELQTAQGSAAVETKVKTVMVDPNSQSPVVVLETVADKKLLPIWIDIPEARAIAIEIEQIKVPVSYTHLTLPTIYSV